MSATYETTQASATGKVRGADFPMTEPLRRILGLSVLALILATPIAHADDGVKPEAIRLGEHPAVIVARRGVQVDPTWKFYLHPARLSWSLQRPLSEGEHPAVLVARKGLQVDPTSKFYLHPAQLSWSLKRPMPEVEQWPAPVASRVPDSTIDSR